MFNKWKSESSYHEVKLFVLESVSNVEVSEFLSACLVIENETGPHYWTNCHNFIILIFSTLNGPQTAGLVINNWFKEIGVEWCSWLIELILISLSLYVSEMQIALKILVSLQSTECFVSSHLMKWCHLEGTNGCDWAIIFNCKNNECKSIKFSQVLWGDLNFFFLRKIAQIVSFSLCSSSFSIFTSTSIFSLISFSASLYLNLMIFSLILPSPSFLTLTRTFLGFPSK